MAAGDIFADTYAVLAGSSTIAIQPAVGVQICITGFWAQDNNNMYFRGGNPSANQAMGSWNGTNAIVRYMPQPLKLFITNSEYIWLYNAGAGDSFYGYTGIEI